MAQTYGENDITSSIYQNGVTRHEPYVHKDVGKKFNTDMLANGEACTISSPELITDERHNQSRTRGGFSYQRSLSYKGPDYQYEDTDYLASSHHRVQKSSTETCLNTSSNEDSFGKYLTSFEEQTRILAEIEKNKINPNPVSSSASHDITQTLPANSFNPSKSSQIDKISLQGKNTNEYSQIADQLAARGPYVEEPEHPGRLLRTMYGTRDAAQNLYKEYSGKLIEMGFTQGRASPCVFHHIQRGIRTYVHGDDYVSSGLPHQLEWMK